MGRHLSLCMGLASSFLLLGCGSDEKSSLSEAELVQNINEVPYRLKEMVVDFDITYENGARDHAKRKFAFREDESKDQMQRRNVDGRYQLVVNGQNIGVDISPNGKLYYQAGNDGNAKGCDFRGQASIDGKATHTELAAVWKLNASLKGEGCSEGLRTRFQSFRSEEVGRLNLVALQNFFQTLNQDLNLATSIQITVRLEGVRE